MSTIHVRIMTPHGLYKEMDTSILNVVTTDGARGILPEHMPLVTMLKISEMTTVENGKRKEYALSGGLLYYKDNTAEVLTDAIEEKTEIDIQRAQSARDRAEKRLSSNDPDIDMIRAKAALDRAMNRLKVSGAK